YGLAEQAIYPGYGMAETVLASTLPVDVAQSTNRLFGRVSCDRIDPDILRREGHAVPAVGRRAAGALRVVGVGRPVQGLDISIRDPSGQVLPDRVVGEICIRGTSLMQGYVGDAETTAAAIREGWYYSGDHGYVADG